MLNNIFLVVFIVPTCFGIDYTNFTLFRGIPVNESQVKFYEKLPALYDVNFWRHPGLKNMPVDFVISPKDKQSFLRTADNNGMYLTVMMENVQEAFNKQTVKSYIRRRTESFDWQNYFKIDDIYNWMQDLAKINSREVEVFSIGKTFENRDIMAAKVILNDAKVRSKIIIEGGIHAREWIAPAFVTYLLDQIVHSKYSENKLLKKIALAHEWYFIPVLNPDGYEYTHATDRLWRKNRHDSGVDINRNFDIAFGTVGISKTPESEIHCGESAFSEKESIAMRDLVQSMSKHLEFYIGFHSYGQYMIIPYAYTKKHLENFDEVNRMAEIAAIQIAERNRTKYIHGTAYDTVGYMTSGVSGCWVKQTYKTPYVVIFELRDEGRYGFALPPSLILPTCEETLDGVMSLINQGTSRPLKLNVRSSRASNLSLPKVLTCLSIIGNLVLYKSSFSI